MLTMRAKYGLKAMADLAMNEGAVFIPTIDRLHSFISRSAGKRLTYRRLIA